MATSLHNEDMGNPRGCLFECFVDEQSVNNLVSVLKKWLSEHVKNHLQPGNLAHNADVLHTAFVALDKIIQETFGLPIQYMHGDPHLNYLKRSLDKAAQCGKVVVFVANCPKKFETLATVLVETDGELNDYCKSLINFTVFQAAALLSDSEWSDFCENFGPEKLAALRAADYAFILADRVPQCPKAIRPDEECKVEITNRSTASAADCIVVALVGALHLAGLDVAMCALGNEGGRCVFGVDFEQRRGNYGSYISPVNGLGSAASGLEFYWSNVGYLDQPAPARPFTSRAGFVMHPLMLLDASRYLPIFTDAVDALTFAFAHASSLEYELVRERFNRRMHQALSMCKRGFSGGMGASPDQRSRIARLGGQAAIKKFLKKAGYTGDVAVAAQDPEIRAFAMESWSEEMYDWRREILKEPGGALRLGLDKGGKNAAANCDAAVEAAVERTLDPDLPIRCRQTLAIYTKSMIKDIKGLDEKIAAADRILSDESLVEDLETVVDALRNGGSTAYTDDPRFQGISYRYPNTRQSKNDPIISQPLSARRVLLLAVDILGPFGWAGHAHLFTDWSQVKVNLIKAGHEIEDREGIDDYDAVKDILSAMADDQERATYGVWCIDSVSKSWRDLKKADKKMKDHHLSVLKDFTTEDLDWRDEVIKKCDKLNERRTSKATKKMRPPSDDGAGPSNSSPIQQKKPQEQLLLLLQQQQQQQSPPPSKPETTTLFSSLPGPSPPTDSDRDVRRALSREQDPKKKKKPSKYRSNRKRLEASAAEAEMEAIDLTIEESEQQQQQQQQQQQEEVIDLITDSEDDQMVE